MSIERGTPPAPIRTACPYCGVGCGVLATPAPGGGWQVTGDPDHPANFGRLCSKGSALGETLDLDGRLLHPEIHGRRVTWDAALDHVAAGLRGIAERHGPEAIAFYLSGQMLTEDYYVANKLAKGFIGTPHVDTNSRLCMASSVAGHKRAFGSDTVPNCYEDLELADMVVLVGSNAAWCHPVLFQRLRENRRRRGARLVTVDVRDTATSQEADLALTIRPGSDAFLFNGLLVHLTRHEAHDRAYMAACCEGFDAALAAAQASAPDTETVAACCGTPADAIRAFYDWFATTERVVTCYSQGIHQSASGTDKVNAILNSHLATGRIGLPGAGPLSLTGQPNAMGGREVGGLANQLAAHMDYGPQTVDRVRRFWGARRMASHEGLKAVAMFDALHERRIRAIWIMATNPAVSLPNIAKVREALQRAELVVVSDCVRDTDTMAFAHVRLPAAAWGEKDGTVTNSERCISRQRAFLPPPGEARPDWRMLCDVAVRIGLGAAFAYDGPAAIFREHAALSAFENDGTRDFDLSGLAALRGEDYDALAPLRWPVPAPGCGTDRLFADGRFFHGDRRARFVAVTPRLPVEAPDAARPLLLNTGRIRDQWHTMTRTAKAPRLNSHRPEPFVEMAPEDATAHGLEDGGLAAVAARGQEVVMRVRVTDGQRPGSLFAPIHWSRTNSSAGSTGTLIAGHVDPLSGQPENKATPVALGPAGIAFTGMVLSRQPLAPEACYWSRRLMRGCWVHVLGFRAAPAQGWRRWAARHCCVAPNMLMEFEDPGLGLYRAAHVGGRRMESVVAVAPGERPLESTALEGLFAEQEAGEARLRAALSLKAAAAGLADGGPIMCACFSVSLGAISDLVASGRAASAEQVGALLKAGTNCGSCLPEIRMLIGSLRAPAAE